MTYKVVVQVKTCVLSAEWVRCRCVSLRGHRIRLFLDDGALALLVLGVNAKRVLAVVMSLSLAADDTSVLRHCAIILRGGNEWRDREQIVSRRGDLQLRNSLRNL